MFPMWLKVKRSPRLIWGPTICLVPKTFSYPLIKSLPNDNIVLKGKLTKIKISAPVEFLFSDERKQKTSELTYIRGSQGSQVEIKQNRRIPRVATSLSQPGRLWWRGHTWAGPPGREARISKWGKFQAGPSAHSRGRSSKKASVSGLEVRRAQEIRSAWYAGPRCC